MAVVAVIATAEANLTTNSMYYARAITIKADGCFYLCRYLYVLFQLASISNCTATKWTQNLRLKTKMDAGLV